MISSGVMLAGNACCVSVLVTVGLQVPLVLIVTAITSKLMFSAASMAEPSGRLVTNIGVPPGPAATGFGLQVSKKGVPPAAANPPGPAASIRICCEPITED